METKPIITEGFRQFIHDALKASEKKADEILTKGNTVTKKLLRTVGQSIALAPRVVFDREVNKKSIEAILKPNYTQFIDKYLDNVDITKDREEIRRYLGETLERMITGTAHNAGYKFSENPKLKNIHERSKTVDRLVYDRYIVELQIGDDRSTAQMFIFYILNIDATKQLRDNSEIKKQVKATLDKLLKSDLAKDNDKVANAANKLANELDKVQ